MVGPWNAQPYIFRALRKTFGQMWLRCDVCRRFAVLKLPPGYLDRDYRTVDFSCSLSAAASPPTPSPTRTVSRGWATTARMFESDPHVIRRPKPVCRG